MKNREYWAKRFEILQEKELANSEKYIEELTEQYKKAYISIEENISKWYTRLAVNNQVNIEDAKKMLTKEELKEFKWTLEEYIEKGKQNGLDETITKQLENASARVHINRLDAMKIQIQAELEQLYEKQDKDITELQEQVYSNMYYNSAYEIQKGLNTAWKVPILPKDLINKVISKPWTTDNLTFSDRIWKNKNELTYTLQTQLTQALIKGDSLNDVINNISKQFNVSRNKAGRLVMTESAFFSSAGQKQCYKNLSVERYEIVATLDLHTSQICRDLDGKVFEMKDYEVGITAPPFHIYCRSVTAPYFEDNYTERIARGEDGKTYYVPSNIKYNEWYDKYVDKEENEKPILVPKDMNYEQWKENYIDNIELKNMAKDDTIKTKQEKITELQDILMDMNEARKEHWNLTLTSKDDITKFPQLKEMSFSVDLQNLDERMIDAIIDNYKRLGNEYYTTLNHIGVFDQQDLLTRPNSGGYAFTKAKTLTGEIHFNQKILNDFDDYIETMRRCSEYGHIPKSINHENYKYYVSTHEFAHSIYNSNMLEKNLIGMDETIYKNFHKELEVMFEDYKVKIKDIDANIKNLNTKFVLNTEKFTTEDSKTLKRLKAEREEIFVSNYAIRDNLEDEFMAECFSEAKLSKNPSKTAKDVIELIDKYFKR